MPGGKGRKCGHGFRVRTPWEGLSTHFTKEFEAFALLLMREMPMSKVGEVVGETDTRLWRRHFREGDAAYALAGLPSVGLVGVEQRYLPNGHPTITLSPPLVHTQLTC